MHPFRAPFAPELASKSEAAHPYPHSPDPLARRAPPRGNFHMRFRHALATMSALASLALAVPTNASPAEDAQGFVTAQHRHLDQLLHEPASPSRDTQIQQVLGTFVDYDELTRRAFGEPCPVSEPGCEDLWSQYTEAQRAEVRSLLEQLVRKTYQRNLQKTLDYEVTYRGS